MKELTDISGIPNPTTPRTAVDIVSVLKGWDILSSLQKNPLWKGVTPNLNTNMGVPTKKEQNKYSY